MLRQLWTAECPMSADCFVFLDRDGTLIRHIPYLCDPSQVELLPTVRDGLQKLKEAGCRLFLHTNQSGVARGYFTLQQAEACNARMIELLGLGSMIFDDTCIATEGPDDEHLYRKPSPRFALEVLDLARATPENLYYVGDNPSDLLTAINAGGTGLGVQTGEFKLRELFANDPPPGRVAVFDTFSEAADYVLAECADVE
jgi:D-glycero-D-manno-heptose 1,7-bisphosphate phosphatase